MSDRLWLLTLVCAGLATPLQAQQSDVAPLERRVERLRARLTTTAAEVSRRDSILFAAQHPRAVGTGPLFLVVPDWAAPILEPEVVGIVAEATEKYGAVFAREPAETLAVRYAQGTPRGPGRYIPVADRDTAEAREGYLAARRFDAERMARDRVGRLLGPDVLAAIGGRYFGGTFAASRRRVVVLLSGDSTGVGHRCLDGSVDGCRQALSSLERGAGGAVRGSLLLWASERAGPDGWTRLVESDARGFEARLAALAGRPYHELVAEWGAALRSKGGSGPRDGGRSFLALGWGLLFVALFGWRLKWHHV